MTQADSRLSRRNFIRLTAGLAVAGGVGLAELARAARSAERVQEARMLLGSIAHLTVISPDGARARAAINAAFDRMGAFEDVMSRFRPHSQLSQLNASGVVTNPHPALKTVLTKAVAYGDLTGGAFDVSVEAVLRYYRGASQRGSLPDADVIAAARELVDYHQISIGDDAIRLNRHGMALTLDGIAKGYIIDAGAAVFREYGFEQVIVELGGDLQAYGSAEQRAWQVSIEQPQGGAPLVAQIVNRALATSGDYLYTFTPDRRLHHIIDPLNGVSPDELSSVSVIAPTACDADALATALMVMGSTAGLALIDRLPDTEALVISKRGVIRTSANFPIRGNLV